jgi:hypothetical protein
MEVTRSLRLDVRSPDQFSPFLSFGGWCGIVAPKNTPIRIIDMLNSEVNTALADPKFKARLADLGVNVFAGSPAEFSNHIAGLIAGQRVSYLRGVRAADRALRLPGLESVQNGQFPSVPKTEDRTLGACYSSQVPSHGRGR